MARRKLTAAGLLAQAEARGYKRGAHTVHDQVMDERRHGEKTQMNHDGTLHRYVLWRLAHLERDHAERGLPVPTVAEVRAQYLARGVELPALATLKDFLRFYIHTSQPRLTSTTTTDSMGTISEWLFAGFTRVTGTIVPRDLRSEVYGWLRKVLTEEGLLVNKRRPKHNFTEPDLTRIVLTAWTKDDLTFVPERYRIQFTYIIRVFCWTGARIGAFFTDGLRYRDIELVLQRTPNAAWKCIYKIDQRWVKNNRDPENIVFGTVLQEHDKFIYDDSSLLLVMAFADKALFGFNTLRDLQEQQIPEGQNELILRWRRSALNKPILRKCTKAGGLTDDPMPRSAFSQIFQSALLNAGYFCAASIHNIRRQLGKKVDELYTEVQRSQHLTQADPRVFGRDYVANTSSVDGQGAFLGEATKHNHIDYFQGLGRFREPGLPCQLPARLEEGLKHDAELRQLEAEVRQCPEGCPTALVQAKQLVASHWKRLKRAALHEHQENWVQERRDWHILTRGKKQAKDAQQADLTQSLSLLFPERLRVARRLTSDSVMTSEDRWLAMEDLLTLCNRDLSILYLPGHQPTNGCCPVKCCQIKLESLPKRVRNQHIQACVRREIASREQQLQTDVHYCHQCFNWVVGSNEWSEHCARHLEQLDSKRCGTITYCHTLVRPAYCPFCLGKAGAAPKRLQSWCRDALLWKHVDGHLDGLKRDGPKWPLRCPHPRCDVSVVDGEDFRFHLIDEHGFSRLMPKNMNHLCPTSSETEHKAAPSKKRKHTLGGVELSWLPAEQPATSFSNRVRRGASTVTPSQLLATDEDATEPPELIDLTSLDSDTDVPESAHLLDDVHDGESDVLYPRNGESLGRFTSCDSTLFDCEPDELRDDNKDQVFSQFIRSPSPESVVAADDAAPEDETSLALVSSPPASQLTFSQNPPAVKPGSRSEGLQGDEDKPAGPLRIRLAAPKLKITLRLPESKTKQQKSTKGKPTKRVRQARKAQVDKKQKKAVPTSRRKSKPAQRRNRSSKK